MVSQSQPLRGRVVVVTGGNGGIGLGIAEAVAAAGAAVAVWARNPDKNEAAVHRLQSQGADALGIRVDVTDEAAVDWACERTVAEFGKIDACVANAAIGGTPVPFVDLTLAEWHRVLAANADAMMLPLRAATRQLVQQGDGGALVTVSSIVTSYGAPANESYAASKAVATSLGLSLAVELARYRIRSNVLRPGWTDTELVGPGGSFTGDSDHERFREGTVRRTPVRRWGIPEDMGPAAVFLTNPDYAFHTGDVITVDGGYCAM